MGSILPYPSDMAAANALYREILESMATDPGIMPDFTGMGRTVSNKLTNIRMLPGYSVEFENALAVSMVNQALRVICTVEEWITQREYGLYVEDLEGKQHLMVSYPSPAKAMHVGFQKARNPQYPSILLFGYKNAALEEWTTLGIITAPDTLLLVSNL